MTSENSADEDVFEVEKIVDNVMVGGKTYYRVHWKNYSADGDTWEPRENLLSCEDLLNNYIREHANKKGGIHLPSDVFDDEGGSDQGTTSTQSTEDSKSNNTKPKKTIADKTRAARRNRVGGTGAKKNTASTSKFSRKDSDEPDSSSSDEEPQVKDPFWKNLEQGKIDVFASDLYSKVKQRRFPEGEKTRETEITMGSRKMKKKNAAKKNDKEQKTQRKTNRDENTTLQKQDNETSEDKEPTTKNLTKTDEETTDDATTTSKDDDVSNISDDRDEQGSEPAGSNLVLQYLDKEMKKMNSVVSSEIDEEKNDTRSEKSVSMETEDTERKKNEQVVKIKEPNNIPNILKPNIVLEKIDKTPDEKKKVISEAKKKASREEEEIRGTKEPEKMIIKEKEKLKDEEKRAKKKMNEEDSLAASEEGKKNDSKSKNLKEIGKMQPPQQQPENKLTDAFSVQLQEVDDAVSNYNLKKKEKMKKSKAIQRSPKPDKSPSSVSPVAAATYSGQSLLEKFTQEIERTVGSGISELKIAKLPSKENHEKQAKEKSSVHSEIKLPHMCVPEMAEFLKIKVNFSLDEISVKDIERHHEMGEPPCRLERDVSNSEFRQYIRLNNVEMVHEALKSKKMMYNLEHTDSVWMTQLMVAAAAGFDEIVRILSHYGAKVNARSKNGQTALMYAAEKGHDIVCKILIAYGAYINLQTTSGETALMKASKNGCKIIARYLLQAGADPSMKSVHGSMAIEMAEQALHINISDFIRIHETNLNSRVNECINRECENLGIKTTGLPILANRIYNIRETPMIHVTFNCVLQNVPPNQGLLLFALHGMIGSGMNVKCRMRGPCYINVVMLNNFLMEPMMPEKQSDECNHFITNLIWKEGQNSLRMLVSQDALSNEKIIITIFLCELD